jgi:asparaginyl-tRNA synthetase
MLDDLGMFNEKTIAILKIRDSLLNAARCWFKENGYFEVQGPTIIPAVGNWPSYFEIKYFDKKAYLAQGLQPYATTFASSLGKVYTIAPTFRAEKLKTKRHLTEYWRIEVAQKCCLDTLLEFEEQLIAHVCQSIAKHMPQTLKCLNRSAKDFAKVQAPFPRITYDEVVELLQRGCFEVNWGQKISWEMEKHLSLKFNSPFYITRFPLGSETFFSKLDPNRPELTLSADLLAPEGYGEIGSSLQRITERKVLSQKMAEENIDPVDQRWYTTFFQRENLPQSGFAIGIERLIQWICGIAHIRETAAFPRLYDSIYP